MIKGNGERYGVEIAEIGADELESGVAERGLLGGGKEAVEKRGHCGVFLEWRKYARFR